jgi:predicted transcriptional regulator
LQNKKPSSIYELAKILKRDFKSVRSDIELLKQFGFVKFIAESKGKRRKLKPVLNIKKLHVTVSL